MVGVVLSVLALCICCVRPCTARLYRVLRGLVDVADDVGRGLRRRPAAAAADIERGGLPPSPGRRGVLTSSSEPFVIDVERVGLGPRRDRDDTAFPVDRAGPGRSPPTQRAWWPWAWPANEPWWPRPWRTPPSARRPWLGMEAVQGSGRRLEDGLRPPQPPDGVRLAPAPVYAPIWRPLASGHSDVRRLGATRPSAPPCRAAAEAKDSDQEEELVGIAASKDRLPDFDWGKV